MEAAVTDYIISSDQLEGIVAGRFKERLKIRDEVMKNEYEPADYPACME